MNASVEIRVYGLVQGVNFRTSTRTAAEKIGVSGFVRNEMDGSVYVKAEGKQEQINTLIEWCKQGPARSKVERVAFENCEWQGLKGFEIRR
ncbi:MAG: acylphosphatase [Cyclobacteriaceae bacterium]|nr:acylphosphatase [Cyclobacteriaceae bacterium]